MYQASEVTIVYVKGALLSINNCSGGFSIDTELGADLLESILGQLTLCRVFVLLGGMIINCSPVCTSAKGSFKRLNISMDICI